MEQPFDFNIIIKDIFCEGLKILELINSKIDLFTFKKLSRDIILL